MVYKLAERFTSRMNNL